MSEIIICNITSVIVITTTDVKPTKSRWTVTKNIPKRHYPKRHIFPATLWKRSVDLWIKPFREDASPQCNLRRMVENRGSLIRPLSFRRRRRSDHQLCEPIHRTNRINLLYITRLTFISNIVAFIREKYLGNLPRAPSPASRHPCVYAFTFKLIFSYWANNIRKLDALHKYNRKNLG